MQANNLKPTPGAPVKSVTQEESLKRLNDLLKSIDKTALHDALARPIKRPRKWSGLTNAPYYRERFGLEFKLVLDGMMKEFAEGKLVDREWKYSDFKHLTGNTIYNKIHQSKCYLFDFMDSSDIYKSFYEKLSLTRERTGVRLSYARDIRSPESDFVPSCVLPKVETPKWKQKMDEFLEKGKDGESFLQKKLSLSNEEIQELEDSLSDIKYILFEVNPDYIKIIKVSPEQWERFSK